MSTVVPSERLPLLASDLASRPGERDHARLAFLARASATLLSSLDYGRTVQQLAELAVPDLGDWCAVDLANADGTYARLGVAHSDPTKVAVAYELWRRYPPKSTDPAGLANVVRTGEPELVTDIPDALLEAGAVDAAHLELIRSLGLRSYLVVPLRVRGRVLGALSLVQAESGRRYQAEDLAIAEELAGIAAIAVDNARLYAESEQARARAEDDERTLRAFVDNLPALAWTARPDGFIDFYNRRWYEYTGTTFEEMQGWGWQRVHDPARLPEVNARWKRSLETGEPFEMEFTLRGADGMPRWFLTRVTPVRDESGAIVRWFGSNTDVHDIKVAQALADEVAAQGRETTELLLSMRAERDRALARVRELEAQIAAGRPAGTGA